MWTFYNKSRFSPKFNTELQARIHKQLCTDYNINNNNVMAGSSFAEIQQASDRCLCPKRCQKKPSHGDFWRFTSINQWVFVNFKILSCLLDFIWPPDFMKFDRTFLTVVRSLSIIFNYFMFLLCGFKILSCYYICKIKLLTQSARLESFYGHDIYRNVFPLT